MWSKLFSHKKSEHTERNPSLSDGRVLDIAQMLCIADKRGILWIKLPVLFVLMCIEWGKNTHFYFANAKMLYSCI